VSLGHKLQLDALGRHRIIFHQKNMHCQLPRLAK
jgi:hypothetical protein